MRGKVSKTRAIYSSIGMVVLLVGFLRVLFLVIQPYTPKSFTDAAVIIFSAVTLLAVTMLGFLYECLLFYASARTIIIDETGITAKFLCVKRKISWEEVKEWGIGRAAMVGKVLYFSTQKLPAEEKMHLLEIRFRNDQSLRLLRPKEQDTVIAVQYTEESYRYIRDLKGIHKLSNKEGFEVC